MAVPNPIPHPGLGYRQNWAETDEGLGVLVELPDSILLIFVLREHSQGTWYSPCNRSGLGKNIQKPLGFKVPIPLKLPFRKLWAISLESHAQ